MANMIKEWKIVQKNTLFSLFRTCMDLISSWNWGHAQKTTKTQPLFMQHFDVQNADTHTDHVGLLHMLVSHLLLLSTPEDWTIHARETCGINAYVSHDFLGFLNYLFLQRFLANWWPQIFSHYSLKRGRRLHSDFQSWKCVWSPKITSIFVS